MSGLVHYASVKYFAGANVTNLSVRIRIAGYNMSSFGPLEQLQFVEDLKNATSGIHKVSLPPICTLQLTDQSVI